MGAINEQRRKSNCPIDHPSCDGPVYPRMISKRDLLGSAWSNVPYGCCTTKPQPRNCPCMPEEGSDVEMRKN